MDIFYELMKWDENVELYHFIEHYGRLHKVNQQIRDLREKPNVMFQLLFPMQYLEMRISDVVEMMNDMHTNALLKPTPLERQNACMCFFNRTN